MTPRGWTKLTDGPVIKEPGNSIVFKTGSWRSFRPVFNRENCIDCLFCWLYCPDMAINVKDGKFESINYDYCKGCGICALECPGKKGNKALSMVEEGN